MTRDMRHNCPSPVWGAGWGRGSGGRSFRRNVVALVVALILRRVVPPHLVFLLWRLIVDIHFNIYCHVHTFDIHVHAPLHGPGAQMKKLPRPRRKLPPPAQRKLQPWGGVHYPGCRHLNHHLLCMPRLRILGGSYHQLACAIDDADASPSTPAQRLVNPHLPLNKMCSMVSTEAHPDL